MKYKVLSLKEMDETGRRMLAEIGAEVITPPETATQAEWIRLIAEQQVDAIFSRTDPVTRAMMDASPNLKVVAKQGVGLDNISLGAPSNKRCASSKKNTNFGLSASPTAVGHGRQQPDRLLAPANQNFAVTKHGCSPFPGVPAGHASRFLLSLYRTKPRRKRGDRLKIHGTAAGFRDSQKHCKTAEKLLTAFVPIW